ncbi:MAG: hypothetical protein HEP71_14505 [Roseivirga sp.]|nr:hypothetical protein [Roseivirga sp.]
MKHSTSLINIICLLLVSFSLSCQESISERAKEDQIASKLWRALGQELNKAVECKTASVIDELATEFQLPNTRLRTFLLYTLNYSSENLKAEQVLYRYPHYNEDSIRRDFMHLTDLGLFNNKTTSWSSSANGDKIITQYWGLRQKEASICGQAQHQNIETLTAVTEKLITAYAKDEAFSSVRLRIANRPDSFDEYPRLLEANEYQRDLTAIFNDNGHYRIDHLIASAENQKWQELSLSPLAKELLGATRSQRVYPVTRCSNQSNWRVGKAGCDLAIAELVNYDLIILEDDSIRQTPKGHELFQAAELLADNRLYSAWNVLSSDEYTALLEAVAWVAEANK